MLISHCLFVVHKNVIPLAGLKMVEALSKHEGCLPVSVLIPSLHCTLHYPHQTKRFIRMGGRGTMCVFMVRAFVYMVHACLRHDKHHILTLALSPSPYHMCVCGHGADSADSGGSTCFTSSDSTCISRHTV